MILTTEYKPEYREQTLRLVKEFEDEYFGEFGLETNLEAFDEAIDELKNSCFILIIDGEIQGALAGTIVKSFCAPGLTWHETLWYVRKPYRQSFYGLDLFEKACETLKARGVRQMMTAHLANDVGKKMGRLYKSLGFKEFETHYIKRFDDGNN